MDERRYRGGHRSAAGSEGALRRNRRRRFRLAQRPAAAAALLAVLAVEPMVAPVYFTPFSGVSTIYESLASEPDAVVVELPMPGGFNWFGNARYMINSTRHWRPMLNGYSGSAPGSFYEHARALARALPADRRAA